MTAHTPGPFVALCINDSAMPYAVVSHSGPHGDVIVGGFMQRDDAVLFSAAPEMREALKAILPELDAEIEQRQHSGNDEYWAGLKALSDQGHAAIAKAEGRA